MHRHLLAVSCLIYLSLAQSSRGQQHHYTKSAIALQANDPNNLIITADDPRPLEQITILLNQQFELLIDYEDPPYVAADELTGSVTKTWLAQGGKEYYIPNGESFEVVVGRAELQAASDGSKHAIEHVVNMYNMTANPGRFESVKEEKDRISIVGVAIRAEKATKFVSVTPIFDTVVRARTTKQTILEAIEVLLSDLSAAGGHPIRIGAMPFGLLTKVIVPPGEAEPARKKLSWLLSKCPAKLAWSLMYDPNDRSYMFNLVSVGTQYSDGSGTTRFVPARQ